MDGDSGDSNNGNVDGGGGFNINGSNGEILMVIVLMVRKS